MSHVTNIILSLPGFEKGTKEGEILLSELHKICQHNFDKASNFHYVDNCKVGGGKCLEANLFIAAFNYLDEDHFIKSMNNIKEMGLGIFWDDFQLMVMGEYNDKWTVYDFDNIHKLDFH